MKNTSELWNEFIKFQAQKVKKYGYDEGLFSGCFCADETLGEAENQEYLSIAIRITLEGQDQAIVDKATSSFVYLGEAMGDGGMYGFMLTQKECIDENPVVFFDSDGYHNVVAQDFKELLTLLSIDTEPMVGYDESEQTSYIRDPEDEHSEAYLEFIQWLKEHDVPVIQNEADYESIGQPILFNAVKAYGKTLKTLLDNAS